MPKIRERMYARCPYGKAPSYLNYYLDTLGDGTHVAAGTLRLTLPLGEMGVPGDLKLSRDVEARFEPLTELDFGAQTTAVEWRPVPPGPFPRFVGTLTVESEEQFGTCALVLEGDYEPPLGAVGEAFDAAVGRRVAIAMARELLRRLRRELEARCRDEAPTAR